MKAVHIMNDNLNKALSMLNQQHQIDTFIEMAKVYGVTGDEAIFAKYMEGLLHDMGVSFVYDKANEAFGGNTGNMIAYWPGTDSSIPPIFFSAHMDTVLSSADCIAEIRDGGIYSDGVHVLGTDDRSSMSGYIEALRALIASGVPCGPIELLITVSEENGLFGAKNIDMSLIKSRHGFVFDHPGDVGQIIRRGPTRTGFEITFKMKEGTAGGHIAEYADRPNAFMMGAEAYQKFPFGYDHDRECVLLIGLVEGGELTSMVPGEITYKGEVRALKQEYVEEKIAQIKAIADETAAKYGGTAVMTRNDDFVGFDIEENNPVYQCYQQACEAIGIKWYDDTSVGGADTNALRMHGLECITLGNGFTDTHSYNEHITIDNLVNIGRVCVSIALNWYKTHKK